jgi:transposase-like protein
MEKSSKRGKIPQSDWPLIMARYEAGETLASIARTYDCSPPAISYVVSRSRERHPGTPATSAMVSAAEPQLIKAPPAEPTAGTAGPQPVGSVAAAPTAAAFGAAGRPNGQPGRDEPPARIDDAAAGHGEQSDAMRPRETNGFAADAVNGRVPYATANPRAVLPLQRPTAESPIPAASGASDPRRTLHLSLGVAPSGNGMAHAGEPHPAARSDFAGHSQQQQGELQRGQLQHGQQPPSPIAVEHHAPPVDREPQYNAPASGRNGAAAGGAAEAAPFAYHRPAGYGEGEDRHRKNGGGAFIDNELRARVDSDIAAFLAAFDSALAQDTRDSRVALREATDRLLRAGARTRIELERLEARVPLPPRDNGRDEPTWRQR